MATKKSTPHPWDDENNGISFTVDENTANLQACLKAIPEHGKDVVRAVLRRIARAETKPGSPEDAHYFLVEDSWYPVEAYGKWIAKEIEEHARRSVYYVDEWENDGENMNAIPDGFAGIIVMPVSEDAIQNYVLEAVERFPKASVIVVANTSPEHAFDANYAQPEQFDLAQRWGKKSATVLPSVDDKALFQAMLEQFVGPEHIDVGCKTISFPKYIRHSQFHEIISDAVGYYAKGRPKQPLSTHIREAAADQVLVPGGSGAIDAAERAIMSYLLRVKGDAREKRHIVAHLKANDYPERTAYEALARLSKLGFIEGGGTVLYHLHDMAVAGLRRQPNLMAMLT